MPTTVVNNSYIFGANQEATETPGQPMYERLSGTFTVAAAPASSDKFTITVNADPYLSVVSVNGIVLSFVKDASEVVTGTKVITGATTTTAATALAAALNTAGFTATSSANVVTVSATTELKIETLDRMSDIIISHTYGVSEVKATGSITLTTPVDGDKLTIGAEVFEVYSVMPYAGANVGVLNSTNIATFALNLTTAITTELPTMTAVANGSRIDLTSTTNVVTSATGTTFIPTQITGYVAPVTSGSTITFGTNAKTGDIIYVTNGVQDTNVNLGNSGVTIGSVASATATNVATYLTAQGFPSTAASNVVTITYGPAYGYVNQEPIVTFASPTTPNLTASQIEFAATGLQLIKGGAFTPYADTFFRGQTVFALTSPSATAKEFTVYKHDRVLDGLLVKPKNGVAEVNGTVYSIVDIPPKLHVISLKDGGITVGEENEESAIKKTGLMTGTPILTGIPVTGAVNLNLCMKTPIRMMMQSALHSSGWVLPKSVTITASVVKTKAAVMIGALNTYTVTPTNMAPLNIPEFGEGVAFMFKGFVDSYKNNVPLVVDKITTTSFTFKSIRELTSETATVTVNTGLWLRNGQTSSTLTLGQSDGFEYTLASGGAPTGFEINSTGRGAVALSIPFVFAGALERNPRKGHNEGLKYPPWSQLIPEENEGTDFLPSRSIAFFGDYIMQVSEASFKFDGAATAEYGAAAEDTIGSDAGLSQSVLTMGNIKPTGSLKCAKSMSQVTNVYPMTENSCPVSVQLRFEAKDSCGDNQRSRIVLVTVPTATAKKTTDAIATDGVSSVTYEYTGGETTVTTGLTNNVKSNYAVQITYFESV